MAEEEDKGGWTEIEVSDQPTDSKEEIEIETPVSEDVSPAVEVMETVKERKRIKRRTHRN